MAVPKTGNAPHRLIMKNKKLMIPLFAFLASLTACESNDLPIQHADSYRYITFAARTQKMTTRADDRYESL